MYSDNIFTLENIQAALSAYNYEQQHDEPIGWCIEHVQTLTDVQIHTSLRAVDALDFIYAPADIMFKLSKPTSETWQFINTMAASSTDLAVCAVTLYGACSTPDRHLIADLALAHISGKALLRQQRDTDIMSEFTDLEEARKRRQLGGLNRAKKINGAIKLRCQAWASEIIERHKNEGRKEPTKANLSGLVDDKYREFIDAFPKETPEYQKLHPPGRDILPTGAGLAPNGSIYNWVKGMVSGQQRRSRNTPA